MPKHNEIDLTAAGITGEEYRKLLHVGFSHREVLYLVSDKTPAAKKTHRRAFDRSKVRALDGPLTMANLLKGKFTRAQAKVLIDVFGA